MKKYIRISLLLHLILCVTALTNEAYSQTYEVVEREDGTKETWYYDSICDCWTLISIDHGPDDQDQDDDEQNPDGGGDNGSDDQGGGQGNDDDDWRDDDPYDDHDWQTHWWQDPWEDWIFVVGGGWTNNNSNNSPQCPELASRTLHGPLQSRIVIGIGEEVDFRIMNRCGATVQWDLENLDNPSVSLGELSNTTNDECKLQAFWQPGRIRITASLSNIGAPCQPSQCGGSSQELTIDMTIIEPNGISYAVNPPQQQGCDEGYEHYENRPSVGRIISAYAMPFHVNFYNVRFVEGEAEADESGPYFANPTPWQAEDLPQTPELNYETMPTATNQVYGGLGTLIGEQEIYARFQCIQDRDPSQAGTARWDIVQYYVNEGQSNTNHNEGTEAIVAFDQVVQMAQNAGGDNSLFTLSKISFGTQTSIDVESNLEDPTSPCNFGNPPTDDPCPPCPSMSSMTLHGPDNQRTEIGIGEEVNITIADRCGATVQWTVENVNDPTIPLGELVNTTDDGCMLKSYWKPGTIRITATLSNLGPDCTNCEPVLSMEFTIIAPNGLYIAPGPPLNPMCNGSFEHFVNRPSAGMIINHYAMPDHVNFYNVRFVEGEAPAVTNSTPYFTIPTPWQPAAHPWSPALNLATIPPASNMVTPGRGTFISEDGIFIRLQCRMTRPPTNQGTVSWNIIQYYIDEGTSNTNHNEGTESVVAFDQTPQTGVNAGGANSLFTVSKSSIITQTSESTSARLLDPTSPCYYPGSAPPPCQ